MSIYPCDFEEAWAPLIPPNRPDNYNKQNMEMKKIIQDVSSSNNNYYNNTQDIKSGGGNNYYQNEQFEQYVPDIDYKQENIKLQRMNKYNQEKSIHEMNQKELLQHIKNCETTMFKILKMIELNNIDNDFKKSNKINEILFYILIGVIVSYIVFTLVNRQK